MKATHANPAVASHERFHRPCRQNRLDLLIELGPSRQRLHLGAKIVLECDLLGCMLEAVVGELCKV
jgi:hypothetical protein